MKVGNGFGSRTTALILNIPANSKYLSVTFKLARLLYNIVSIKIPYYSRIILNSFYNWLFPKYSGIMDACLSASYSVDFIGIEIDTKEIILCLPIVKLVEL